MPRIALLCAVFAACVVALLPNQTRAVAQDKKKAGPKPKPTLPKVGPVPEQVRTDLNLDPFYTKYADAGGLPVLASKKVNDRAVAVAAWLILQMSSERPDILKAIADAKMRYSVIGATELMTDLPEYAVHRPMADYWNNRARGLGASTLTPAASSGEENLLGLPGDRYRGECVLVHEFGHTMHDIGLNAIDPKFDTRLKELFDGAMKKGLWAKTYSATDHKEYWAEGLQSYFDCNMQVLAPNGIHNGVWNNALLKKYDPGLHELIDETLKSPKWRRHHPIPAK